MGVACCLQCRYYLDMPPPNRNNPVGECRNEMHWEYSLSYGSLMREYARDPRVFTPRLKIHRGDEPCTCEGKIHELEFAA